MRSRLVIAALSGVVIGLFALALFLGRQLAEAQRQLAGVAQAPVSLPTNSAQRPSRLRLQQLPAINLPTRVVQLDWRSIESEDYAAYIANLRKAGCPEETIRDIIVTDVNKLFAVRRRALEPPTADWRYWLNPDETRDTSASDASRDREAELLALEHERRKLLTDLLGPAGVKAELQEFVDEAYTDRSLQFLPEGKRQAVAQAQALYRQAEEDLVGITDPDELAKRTAEAQKGYEDAMAAALTPEERNQYEMRSSALADGLREKLRGFGSTRGEFEKLFQLEGDYARERTQLEAAGAAGSDPQAREKLEAAALQLEQSIKETLGPQRYADYQRSQDPDYQALYGLTRQHEVPTTVANQVWDMRRAVELQTGRIRENPLLTAEQKIRALEAVRTETHSAVVEVLGEPLVDEYSRQGGQWLTELTDPQHLGETGVQVVPPPLPEPQVVLDTQPSPLLTRPPRNRRTR